MKDRIRALSEQIRQLEAELRSLLHEQETRVLYQIVGTQVHFKEAILRKHRALKMNVLHWLGRSSPRNVLAAPVIYGMIGPLSLLDLSVTIYQHLCFRLYRIPRVSRSKFIVIDRHRLAYLNTIERLNCAYCGYANGVIAYTREIVAMTEQYWCPIKHARRILGVHPRYANFLDYGAADGYQEQLTRLRAELRSARGARRAG